MHYIKKYIIYILNLMFIRIINVEFMYEDEDGLHTKFIGLKQELKWNFKN